MDKEDFINTLAIPTECMPIDCGPVGCINRNFCSSFLFLLPVIYGYSIEYPSVIYGSIVCLLTSTAHHYYKSQHKIFQCIDRLCVNSIAAYFILNCIITIGFSFYANLMYLSVIATLIVFFIIFLNPQLYERFYFLVHVLAISGILFYIKAYHEGVLSNIAGN